MTYLSKLEPRRSGSMAGCEKGLLEVRVTLPRDDGEMRLKKRSVLKHKVFT
jgi:hypothetical protein